MNQTLKSGLPEEMSIISNEQMITTLMPESEEELNSLLIRVKEEGKKLA